MFSLRTRESIKTALAVVIAFGIAFYAGWDKPFWSAFAVIMISLDTTGQSLNKAAMRMLGTVVGVCAALTFFALFPQDRWGMLVVLCLYYGFCVYMVAGPWRPYFWFVSVFVCLVVIVDGAPVSTELFSIAMARFEETAMGILVYSVISILLWPTSSRADLEAAAEKLFAIQADLYRASLARLADKGSHRDLQPVAIREIQALGLFEKHLEAAINDSYEAWEMRHRWRQYHGLSKSLMQTLGRWRETLEECRHLDWRGVLPNHAAFTAELDRRATDIRRMLQGKPPQTSPTTIKLEVGVAEARALPHIDRAALAAFKVQLDRLEELTRDLFQCVKDIKGFGATTGAKTVAPTRKTGFALDPDRLHASATVVATLIVAYCVWIYLDPPMHVLFVFLPTQWALVSVMARQNVVSMVPGFLVAYVVAGIAYIFVMPSLSGYVELGTMLFLVVFALFWLLFDPRHRGTRTTALANFVVLISLENNQDYDVANFFLIVAGMSLSVFLAMLTQYFPFSPRPEKVFLRLLHRFFRQLEFLLTRLSLDWERQRGLWGLWRTLLYRADIIRIPARLAALADRIDYSVLPGTSQQRVHDLAAAMQALAFRITELMDTREPEKANPLVLELLDDLSDWRLAARDVAHHWAEDPGRPPPVDIDERLAARIKHMEERIDEVRDKPGSVDLSQEQVEGLYRVVGAFRALSVAGSEYANLAAGINWPPWKEARF